MDELILIIKYIIVALVQGIGEILPISSSGHMVIVQSMLGLKTEDLTFEIFLHFASLIAIIAFFYKKLWLMIKSFFQYVFNKENRNNEEIKHNFFLCIFLVIATIPAGIVGLLLDDFIGEHLSKMWIVGCFLLLTSAMLYLITKINRNRDIKEMNWFDALVFGLFQCIGVLPGVSRSGSCIAEFAFIMAIPIMLGSAVFQINDISVALNNNDLFIPYVIAFLVTLVVTYIALKVFLKFVRKQKLTTFSIYCLIVGITSIVLGLTIYK